jgi:hydrogenase nickel incorporation protein HypA/HybF
MHEYSIAYDIYMTARRAALDHDADRVLRVHVDMGELAMANPEQVKFLFDAISQDDPLFQGTELTCHAVPPAVRCECGYEGSELYVCPTCGKLPDLVRGREILVTNIEVEVREA